MDSKTFKKQLLEALQKPDDWHFTNGYLTHRWTGIRMHAEAISSHASSICVFAAYYGITLLTLSFDEVITCYHTVQRRNRETQEERDERNRRAFLKNFGGFEQ